MQEHKQQILVADGKTENVCFPLQWLTLAALSKGLLCFLLPA